MQMTQCMKCKNANVQCKQSFVMYYSALQSITILVNDGNRDSRFFKDNPRTYDFVDIKCSHFEPKEESNKDMEEMNDYQ